MAKKLSTEEILAAARKESGKGEAKSGKPADESPAEETGQASEEQPVRKDSVPARPAAAGKPKSTADILAAARAQAKGGSEESESRPAAKPASKAGGGAKSTADILAAARAQAGGGGGEVKSAALKKATAAGDKPAAPAGDKPSVQEMLKAVREGKPVPKSGEAKKTMPPRPERPAPKKSAKKEERRNVLLALVTTPFAFAWTCFSTASLAATLGVARFMFPNVLVEPPSKFKVGPPSDYPFGGVATKWKAQFGVWLVHAEYEGQNLIYALSSVCTHLGCTPNWLESEQKFKCPCHGSGFFITGVHFEGPAPRPLERVGIRLAEDGMLEVDKSKKFQQELGQWVDPASKVVIS